MNPFELCLSRLKKVNIFYQSFTLFFIFLDFIIDEQDGLGFLMDLPQAYKEKTPIILITGYGNEMIAEDSLAVGAKGYLNKDNLTIQSVNEAINKALISS